MEAYNLTVWLILVLFTISHMTTNVSVAHIIAICGGWDPYVMPWTALNGPAISGLMIIGFLVSLVGLAFLKPSRYLYWFFSAILALSIIDGVSSFLSPFCHCF